MNDDQAIETSVTKTLTHIEGKTFSLFELR